jgi:alanyl-tRNA synthetase
VAFAKTLDRGEAQFERVVAQAAKAGQAKLSGDVVWRLYDTYGFPFDLTVIMCEERGLTFDQAEVDAAREKAKEASKVVKDNAKTFKPLNVHHISELDTLRVARTDDDAKFVKGDIKSKIQLVFTGEGFVKSTKEIPEGTPLGLLLDKTAFYAESGGQVADSGRIVIDDVAEFEVVDVQSYGSYILHNGFIKYGELSAGDEVLCEYDELRREPIRNNHTATHVLNHSLREVLGNDVSQKGSIVDDGKLRFDFSHKTAVKIEELERVEAMSNADIEKALKVYSKDVDLGQAKQIEGLRAVFGETYPDPVRVVSIGMDIDTMLADPKNAEWRKYSIEFCGGTHVEQTGAIKKIVLVEESGIAKGIRRIVAYTGAAAADVQRKAVEMEKRVAELEALPFGPGKEQLLKQTTLDFNQLTISVLTKDALKKRLDVVAAGVLAEQKKRQKEELQSAVNTVVEHFSKNEDATWFVGQLPISANAKALMEVANHFKNKDKAKSVYVFGGSQEEGNVVHAVYVGTDLSSKGVSAGQWAASVCEVIGGKSGGKEPLLQGRGTNPEKLDDAIATATKWVEEKLKL